MHVGFPSSRVLCHRCEPMWAAIATTFGLGYAALVVAAVANSLSLRWRGPALKGAELIRMLGVCAPLSLLVSVPAALTGWAFAEAAFAFTPALVVGVGIVGAMTASLRRAGSNNHLAARLVNSATRPRALLAVDDAIGVQVKSPRKGATLLPVGAALLHIGEFARAARAYDLVWAGGLNSPAITIAANNHAVARMNLGDPAGAGRVLARAPSEIDDPLTRAFFNGTRALLVALEGEHALALELASEVEKLGFQELSSTLLEVRLVAFASRGETDEATDLLARGVDASGRQFLESVSRKGGPAADLASRLLDGIPSPYR